MTKAADALPESARAEPGAGMRRVSPWMAALLTLFFGWGMGHFYARQTRTAILITIAMLGAHILFCLGMYWLSARGTIPPPHPYSFDWRELGVIRIGLPIETIPFAVWAWFSASRRRFVQQAGPQRLWGYLALWLAPMVLFAAMAPIAPWQGGWSARLVNGSPVFE